MKRQYKILLAGLLFLFALFFLMFFLKGIDLVVLNPKGMIGLKERDLLIFVTLVMSLIVVPVFILAIVICWKYRASNIKAKYTPNWHGSYLAEVIWWGFPLIITIALGIVTWEGCHELDPFKPIVTGVKPLKVQVVALEWKWLFIYPEQGVATVNFMPIPEQTPISFEVTADAPMNSFWIPQLGGQIYAMAGMSTKLHLIANEIGVFRGLSANLSGKGFADMKFIAKASSREDFESWVQEAKNSSNILTLAEYDELMKPSESNPVVVYVLKEEDLYNEIIMKYMMPENQK